MAPPAWHGKKKSLLSFLINFYHVVNVILFLSGLGLVGVGVWSLLYKQENIILVRTVVYWVIPWVLLVAAGFSLLVPVLGSCAVSHHNRCLLLLYIFSVLLVLVVEGMTGGLAWVYRDKVQLDLSGSLEETFQSNYGVSPSHTQAIDHIQQEYKCCGAKTFEEWLNRAWLRGKESNNTVPDSCCKSISPGCGQRHHPSNIPYTGCIHRIGEELEQHLVIVCAVSLGVSIIPVVGIILACWIYIKMKDHSQYNGYTQGTTNQI